MKVLGSICKNNSFGLIASSIFEEEEYYIFQSLKKFKNIIAVDGGLNLCSKLGISPDYFVGDLDSCDKSILTTFPNMVIKMLPKDKDETDLEAAINFAFNKSASQLDVFCAFGGRTDHLLGNIHLLSRFPGKIFLDSSKERAFSIHKSYKFSLNIGQTLSFIPLNGPVIGITTKGLKWELTNQTLDKKFIGISNIALRNVIEISISEGDLICIIQKDIV